MELPVLEASRWEGCKVHPNDTELPGVCSACLRDKLSQLHIKNPIIVDPLYCSPSPTSPDSPPPFSPAAAASSNHVNRGRFRRNSSHAAAADSFSCVYGLNLKKSRSVAVVSRSRVRERDVNGGWVRKKDGFWSKVLKLTK